MCLSGSVHRLFKCEQQRTYWGILNVMSPDHEIKKEDLVNKLKNSKTKKRSPKSCIHLRYLLFSRWSRPHMTVWRTVKRCKCKLHCGFSFFFLCVTPRRQWSLSWIKRSSVRSVVTARRMNDTLHVDIAQVMCWAHEWRKSVDQDNCSQLRSSDLSGGGRKKEERICFYTDLHQLTWWLAPVCSSHVFP